MGLEASQRENRVPLRSQSLRVGEFFKSRLPKLRRKLGLVKIMPSKSSPGMSIGQNGMVVASKALALTAIDLFSNPALVQAAWADFDRKLTGKTYRSFISAGEKPPINCRDH